MRAGLLLAVASVAVFGQEPAKLVESIRDGDYLKKSAAVRCFEDLGEAGAPAVPGLIALLAGNEEAADFAAQALGHIGAPAVDALRKELDAASPQVRLFAISALGRMGPRAEPAATQLTARLKDEDRRIRIAAAKALGQTGSTAAVGALLAALKDAAEEVQSEAARSLGTIGADLDRVVPALFEHVREGVFNWSRIGALDGLAALGPRVVPYVLKELPEAEKEPEEAYWCDLVLLLKGHEAALPALLELLSSPATDVEAMRDRSSVVGEALAPFGEAAAIRVAPLLDGDVATKLKALAVLSQLGEAAAPARDRIVKASTHEDPAVRVKTVPCLGALKQRDALLGLLDADPDMEVRNEAAIAVAHLGWGDERLAQALVRAARVPALRASAMLGLRVVGVANADVKEAVLAGIRDEDEGIRLQAIETAGGLRIAEAAAPLGEVAQHGTLATRWMAVETLRKLGRLARPALPALKELLLRTDDAELKAEIAKVIASIEKEPR